MYLFLTEKCLRLFSRLIQVYLYTYHIKEIHQTSPSKVRLTQTLYIIRNSDKLL